MNEDAVWEKVKLARHPKRPTAKSIIKSLFPDFMELHGDRLYGDDSAFITGIATFQNGPITIIAQEKGTTTEEKIKHNFGMGHPEGYRKALRIMKQAEKFNRPIFCIVDTPGAYPGIGAEERGQAQAIAFNLREIIRLRTPIIIVVLSEGGSGGALAIGVGDSVAMFENSIYSILSPEGFASILYKDATKAKEAAAIMKITPEDLKELSVIDTIIPEDEGLHINPKAGFEALKNYLINEINRLKIIDVNELVDLRFEKFRKMGQFEQL
jgi:acetyl-CoA carboxylase carboxyl transferase subunit alpha